MVVRRRALVGVLLALGLAITWNLRRPIRALGHACLDVAYLVKQVPLPRTRPEVHGRVVAHAGGGVRNRVYTNSREALDWNYQRGHRIFELDFERTLDGSVVLIHDWEGSWSDLHPGDPAPGRRNLQHFLKTPMVDGLHPVAWPALAEWMRSHPDAWVVTDVKADNLPILRELAREPDLRQRIIPQIYAIAQFEKVAAMDFHQVWLTLYRRDYPNWALERIFDKYPIAALVCPPRRALYGGLAQALARRRVPVFVHTVNDEKERDNLLERGVYGVYTDTLENR